MKRTALWGLRLSLSSYVLLHFFTYIYETKLLLSLLGICGLLMLLFTFLTYRFNSFKLPISLVFFALLILIVRSDSLMSDIIEGFIEM